MAQVHIDPQVPQAWLDNEGWLTLEFRTDAPPADAYRALRVASDDIVATDVPIEMWEPVPLPSGAGVYLVVDPPEYDVVVGGLRDRLQAAGLSGGLHYLPPDREIDPLWERPGEPREFFEYRLSVPGEPLGRRWRAADAAIDAVVDHGVRWCRLGDARRPELHYASGMFGLWAASGVVADLLRLPADSARKTSITALQTSRGFRRVSYNIQGGYVSYLCGVLGAPITGWRSRIQFMRQTMIDTAAFAEYGLLKRGTNPSPVAASRTLTEDWVPLEHLDRPRALSRARPLEQRYVPDAFGVQLLGHGHKDRLPDSPRWTLTALGAGRTLVEDDNVAAWYAHLRPEQQAVTTARRDFSDLLMTDELISAHA